VPSISVRDVRELLPAPCRHDCLGDPVPFPESSFWMEGSLGGGSSIVVRVGGDLDFSQADMVRKTLCSLVARTVVVDLGRLTFIDSEGLASLVLAQRAFRDRGRQLRLRGARGVVRRIFEATDMLDVLST
jgi:anti-sigma B factor antagonist